MPYKSQNYIQNDLCQLVILYVHVVLKICNYCINILILISGFHT